MELPKNLKELYRHWEKHVEFIPKKASPNAGLDLDKIKAITNFIEERISIWERKLQDSKQTLTTDIILQNYRFCNIYRELDKQTIYFHTKLNPLRNDFPRWLLNILFCRLICRPETIENIGLLSFERKRNLEVYQKLIAQPSPKFGTAYIFPISVIMRSEYPTRELFFTQYLPEVIEGCANEILKFKNLSVIEALERILPVFGFNLKFHWTEVLIDIAYQYPELINLYGKFPIGPGSLPTMKSLTTQTCKDPQEICLYLTNNPPIIKNLLQFNGKEVPLSAENWEGIGCEFRKYTNLKNGRGRKRIYR